MSLISRYPKLNTLLPRLQDGSLLYSSNDSAPQFIRFATQIAESKTSLFTHPETWSAAAWPPSGDGLLRQVRTEKVHIEMCRETSLENEYDLTASSTPSELYQ